VSDPVAAVQAFYDRHSLTFLQHAGPTFQAGLVRGVTGGESPANSNLALAARAGVQPGDRVLDAGCGVGGPAMDIVRGIEGVHVDGVTVSAVQVQLAEERLAEADLVDRVAIQQADYHHLPYGDGTFDCALFLESAGYSTDLPRLFVEAFRVLKPGGRLYIKDVFRREGTLTAAQLEELAAYDDTWAMPATPPVSRLVAAVEGAGFIDARSDDLDLGSSHFIGSMFELGANGLTMNAFGEGFFRRFVDLPILFAEVRARRP
jgi:SAM-dependent methyltransferase